MRVRFAYRSRFPKQIERILPRQKPRVERAKSPLEDVAYSGYICPRCFSAFRTAEERKAHRPACAMDKLAAKAAAIEPRLPKMNPAQRDRAVRKIREQFDRLNW